MKLLRTWIGVSVEVKTDLKTQSRRCPNKNKILSGCDELPVDSLSDSKYFVSSKVLKRGKTIKFFYQGY